MKKFFVQFLIGVLVLQIGCFGTAAYATVDIESDSGDIPVDQIDVDTGSEEEDSGDVWIEINDGGDSGSTGGNDTNDFTFDFGEEGDDGSYNIPVDNVGPTGEILYLNNGDIVSDIMSVSVTAIDSSGVQLVNFYYEEASSDDPEVRLIGTETSASDNTYTITWDTTTVTDQKYHVFAEMVDALGNSANTDEISLIVDNEVEPVESEPPFGSLVSPVDEQKVTDSVLLALQIESGADNVDRVEFKNKVYYYYTDEDGNSSQSYDEYEISDSNPDDDNSPIVYSPGEDGLYTYEWDTSKIGSNVYRDYYVVAYIYGKTGSLSISRSVLINVDNMAPQINHADAVGDYSVDVVFDEELQDNDTHRPTVDDFAIQIQRGKNIIQATITDVYYYDKVVHLYLDESFLPGDTATFEILNDSPSTIVDLHGNFFDFDEEYDHNILDEIPPYANFSAPVTFGKADEPISFFLTSAYDLFTSIESYELDFGDESEIVTGGELSITDGEEMEFAHTYAERGTYDVSLTLYDATRNSDDGFDMPFPNKTTMTVKAVIGDDNEPAELNYGGVILRFYDFASSYFPLEIVSHDEAGIDTSMFNITGMYFGITSGLVNGTFSVNLTFDYQDNDNDGIIDYLDINENDLNVYYGDDDSWILIEKPVRDTVNNTITVTVDHFTAFTLMSKKSTGAGSGGSHGSYIKKSTQAEVEVELQSSEVAAPFSDISGHWAETYIETLRLKGLIHGMIEGKFEPEQYISRAEIVKMAVALNALQLPASVTEKPFSDVKIDAWYAPYIAAAKTLELIDGYNDGTFKPMQKVSRIEALKILLAAKTDLTAQAFSFTDTETSAWYAKYVNYANASGLMTGYPDGTFGPHKSITRAEVAKIIAMILGD